MDKLRGVGNKAASGGIHVKRAALLGLWLLFLGDPGLPPAALAATKPGST